MNDNKSSLNCIILTKTHQRKLDRFLDLRSLSAFRSGRMIWRIGDIVKGLLKVDRYVQV